MRAAAGRGARGLGGYPTGFKGARNVSCPTCSAIIGARCRSVVKSNGNWLKQCHKARVALWRSPVPAEATR
jgi:hypothetical protein